MKEEYQAPVLEELESTLDCQFVAGDSTGDGLDNESKPGLDDND